MDDAYDKQYKTWSHTQFREQLRFKDEQIDFYRSQNLELRAMIKSQGEQLELYNEQLKLCIELLELYKKLAKNTQAPASKLSNENSNVSIRNMIVLENKAMSENTSKTEQSEVNMIFNDSVTGATGVNKGVININTSEQQKTLAESAAEIQRLLKQLEETNPSATEPEQIAYVNLATKPDLRKRAVSALKEGGEVAIEEFFWTTNILRLAKQSSKVGFKALPRLLSYLYRDKAMPDCLKV